MSEGSLAAPVRASRRQAIQAWAGFALVLGVCAFSAVLAADSLSAPHTDSGFSLLVTPIAVTSAALGVLVRLRRPDNLVGWLLIANALSLASVSLAWPYAYYGAISHPGSLPGRLGRPLESDRLARDLCVPDGDRIRLPGWAPALATLALGGGRDRDLLPRPRGSASPSTRATSMLPSTTSASRPRSYPSSLELIWIPFYVGVLGSLFAAFFAVRSRLHHAEGTERIQTLWFTSAAALIPVALVVNILGGLAGDASDVVTGVAIFAMLIAIPAAVAIGILRYRLFDIELVINRTVVYGTLTLCIVLRSWRWSAASMP